MNDPYDMPPIQVGNLVQWFHGADPNGKPSAALVTSVNQFTVDLAVFHSGMANAVCRYGVRHVDHPDARRPEMAETGGWRYVPNLVLAGQPTNPMAVKK